MAFGGNFKNGDIKQSFLRFSGGGNFKNGDM